MDLTDYVDSNLAGESFRSSSLSLPVFVAGFLQETIQSEVFIKEKIRHLSFLVHLVVRYEDFQAAHSEFLEVEADLARGATSWEDEEYFRAWESKMWSKIFFHSHQSAQPVKTDNTDIDFVLENVKTQMYDSVDKLDTKQARADDDEEEETDLVTELVSETDFSCGLCHLKASSKEELLLHVKTSHPAEDVSLTQFTKAIARKVGRRKATINTCDICKVRVFRLF